MRNILNRLSIGAEEGKGEAIAYTKPCTIEITILSAVT